MSETGEKENKTFEIVCGITLALFAAILAVTDLGGGKFGDDEMIAHNEKANAYQWYNSKSIKQNLAEGQRDILKALVVSGTIKEEQLPAVQTVIGDLEKQTTRYSMEKKEILLGSDKVGKENWLQDVDGKLGVVIGAKEWEHKADGLNDAGDVFDLATLFLQLCLVLGAISLVIVRDTLKRFFYGTMVILGIIGTVISIQAWHLALAVG
jgi:hypothetical protein